LQKPDFQQEAFGNEASREARAAALLREHAVLLGGLPLLRVQDLFKRFDARLELTVLRLKLVEGHDGIGFQAVLHRGDKSPDGFFELLNACASLCECGLGARQLVAQLVPFDPDLPQLCLKTRNLVLPLLSRAEREPEKHDRYCSPSIDAAHCHCLLLGRR
jgi:hypothetical protein